VPHRFLPFDHLADVRLFAGVAFTRQTCAAGAADLVVPRLIWVVLASLLQLLWRSMVSFDRSSTVGNRSLPLAAFHSPRSTNNSALSA
jgi:hypothetical protein